MMLPSVTLLSLSGMGVVALFAIAKTHPVARIQRRARARRGAPNV